MTTTTDHTAWRSKARKRSARVLVCALAVLLISWAAHAWIDRWPVTVKLGRSTASGSIHCLNESGSVIRLDYNLWLGTSYAGRLPLDTGVQVGIQRWRDESADSEGKPTLAQAISTIQSEFAKLCEQHGCPQLATSVDVEKGAGNLRLTHPEYAARRRTVDALEFAQAASGMTAIAAAIALLVIKVQRWRDARTIPAWCCKRCRYDLRNIQGRACPECGGPGLHCK